MSELDYRICRIIKELNKYGIDPYINDIAEHIDYSLPGVRYHLEKLIKLKIVEKKDRRYYLLVNNIK